MRPTILQSDRYILKPYQKSDESRFLEIIMDNQSTHFMGGATGIAEEERKRFHKIFQIYEEQIERIFWIWGIYQNDTLCGHLELKETEHTLKDELEIVYMIHPTCRQKGIMTEVLKLMKDNQSMFCKKIIATVELDNEISLKMLRKLGVVKEEILVDKIDNEEYLKLTLE